MWSSSGARSLCLVGVMLTLAPGAWAQDAAPAAAPAAPPTAPPTAPGQQYPPYPYPPPYAYPPGYAPYPYAPYPYGYAYPAPPTPPATRPYSDGDPVPAGYHVEEHVRRGLVIGGVITFAVPYSIGFSVVAGDSFPNQTGWLVLPVLGPWITLAARKRTCDPDTIYDYCSDDNSTRSLLILDGFAQTTGAALLAWGLASTTKQLVRDDVAHMIVAPTHVGSGYGMTAAGTF